MDKIFLKLQPMKEQISSMAFIHIITVHVLYNTAEAQIIVNYMSHQENTAKTALFQLRF